MPYDQGEWLDVAAAAARWHVSPGTFRAYVSRGYAPKPDDPDEGEPVVYRRRPRWRAATLDGWVRPGAGAHTELAAHRSSLAAEHRAALAESVEPATQRQAWLEAHHRALLAAADMLVDLRDALGAAAGDRQDQIEEAIDAAGEAMDRLPSLSLAAAVASVVKVALHTQMRERLSEELVEALVPMDRLREGYELVRPPRALLDS